ncbi:MAG: HAMP domain-containing histidine kinase [Rhodococcus sp.]|nr:HAMP domain-containing histidine kinase [Rhodococcus sp. (in: high G+C Gram-positive bacteria)]
MKRLIALLALLAAIAVGAAWAVAGIANRPAPAADVVGLNDAVASTAANWPYLKPADYEPAVTVVDATGHVLIAGTDPLPDALTAARHHALAAPVVVDDEIVATVYYADGSVAAEAAARRTLATTATIAIVIGVLLVAGVATTNYVRVVRPFERLRDFASEVAGGNLDAPLAMDRGNVFGAWTESFDLMRSELAAARQREQAVEESKRTLLAQISHDIRTPVATIAATAEVLAASEDDEAKLTRLHLIEAKSAQIEALVADLFRANESELAALRIEPTEFASTDLGSMLRGTVTSVRLGPIPPCVVRADRLRLQQVFDNILANSEKYAGTDIDVTFAVDELLHVTISDDGPGVAPDELEMIFGRGVRGSNVGDVTGHGLGLFTCAYLMDRMGGSISAPPTERGFQIVVGVPLA